MIIYYNKRNGKILGTEDMTFINEGGSMHWDDIPDKYIGKKFIGGKGKIIRLKDGSKTIHVKRDHLWNIMREHEDTPGKINLLGYKIKKRRKGSERIINRKGKVICID